MKKIGSVVFTAMLIASSLVSCQKDRNAPSSSQDYNQYILGCQFLPDEAYNAIPLQKAPVSELKALPALVNLPAPPVGDQGSEGSCVAFGTTYAGRSIDWYQTFSNTAWSQSVNIFSPEYVYNQIKISTCASGTYVTSGLNLLKDQGVCTWTSMPYTNGPCSVQPNAAQVAEAANYKINSYARVSITETEFKNYLAAGKPVIVAGPVNNSFMYLGANRVLTNFTGQSLGGHCYCVVGYDNSKKAFKFENSWGPGWATAGFGYIAYKNMKSWWKEAYVVNTTPAP
jgi:C1A family cysteine protease